MFWMIRLLPPYRAERMVTGISALGQRAALIFGVGVGKASMILLCVGGVECYTVKQVRP